MNKNQTIISNNARFQILENSLVRLEYSDSGKFIDSPSVAVLNRSDWNSIEVFAYIENDWLNIKTKKIHVKYKIGSGIFASDNLKIAWYNDAQRYEWSPGDIDDSNLGGVPPTMDGVNEFVNSPGALSKNGYFLLDDSTTPIRDSASRWIEQRNFENACDWYFFIYNKNYKKMLRMLSQLLGPVPMIPRYMIGAWFTSRADYSQKQWQMIASRFREELLPLDILVLDSCSWTNSIWSGYDWDYEQLPDPKGFFDWCEKNGLKVAINEHYADLTPNSDHNFDFIRNEMQMNDDIKEIKHDLANKKYAELFMDILHKPAFDLGLSFWWQDGWANANMTGLDPCMWTREIEYYGSEKITCKRAFMFCRLGSGWGTHRYGSYFTGDMTSNWDTLALNIDAAIKGGNMLVPWVNHDTGAIFGVKIDDELYLRWLQFGAFSPIYRLHSLWGMRLPWEYGKNGVACYRKFAGYRYSLIPYLYSYARIAHDKGLPIAAGMYIYYPDQSNSYEYPLQYMFGRELLIAPITESNKMKPVIKKVFLPQGSFWFDINTENIYCGNQVIDYECPIENMPIFARSGSIIPKSPFMCYSDQKPVDPLLIDIYAGDDANFELYEDDGISLDERSGKYALTKISFNNKEYGNYKLKIRSAKGKYKDKLRNRRYEICIHGLLKPKSVILENDVLEEISDYDIHNGWMWDNINSHTVIKIKQPIPTNRSFQIDIIGAGSINDIIMVQKLKQFRERVRKVKMIEKIRYAELLEGADHCKPPRVIRETEKIENLLDNAIRYNLKLDVDENDIKQMEQSIIDSFSNMPFESERSIPDINESSIASALKIADGKFTEEQIREMISIIQDVNEFN